MGLVLLQVVTVKTKDVKVMHQSSVDGVEDMISLSQLQESSLLHNLRLRYYQDKIYVSRNPAASP